VGIVISVKLVATGKKPHLHNSGDGTDHGGKELIYREPDE
jgi:hypothetical protein